MIKVYVSSVIDAPADQVWAQIRDFNALPKWTPFVAESRIEGGMAPDTVGCVRNFRLKDGGVIREQLLALVRLRFSVHIFDPRKSAGGGELRGHPQAHSRHRR